MSNLGKGFFQIADSKYCANPSCKSQCETDPKCIFYSTEEPNAHLYQKQAGGGGGLSPLPPTAGPAKQLITSIQELQDVEEYLFQNLEKLNRDEPSNAAAQNEVIKRINEVTDLRRSLFVQLTQIYKFMSKHTFTEKQALSDQTATIKMVEYEINRLKQETQELMGAKNDKLRMVQIGEYEFLRYNAHRRLMKIIAFTSLGLVLFSYLLKAGHLGSKTGGGGLILVFSIGIVLLGKTIYDLAMRDNMNYMQYEFPSYEAGSEDLGVIQYDERQFEKLWGETEKKAAAAGDKWSSYLKKEAGKAKRGADEDANKREHFSVVHPYSVNNPISAAPFN